MQNITNTATLILVDEAGATRGLAATEPATKRFWEIALHGWGAERYEVVCAQPVTQREARHAALAFAETRFAAEFVTVHAPGWARGEASTERTARA